MGKGDSQSLSLSLSFTSLLLHRSRVDEEARNSLIAIEAQGISRNIKVGLCRFRPGGYLRLLTHIFESNYTRARAAIISRAE
jgi:hypothetical protein